MSHIVEAHGSRGECNVGASEREALLVTQKASFGLKEAPEYTLLQSTRQAKRHRLSRRQKGVVKWEEPDARTLI